MTHATALQHPACAPATLAVHRGEAALLRLAEQRAPSGFQSVGWLEAYLRETGQMAGFVVLECGPLLLPLVTEKRAGLVLGVKPGDGHASYALAAMKEGVFDDADLREIAREAGFDALLIADAPGFWRGVANPLLALPHQPAPSRGAALTLEADAEALLLRLSDRDDRKKLRQKSTKLAAFGDIRTGWAETEADIRAALESYLGWKASQFASLGIADPFAEAGIRAFLIRAALAPEPAIRLFTLHAGERLVAVLGGATGGGAFSGMFTAYDPEPGIARQSPGEILVVALIRALVAEGYTQFDLGVGEARYKAHYCPESIDLFDIALPVSLAGQIAAQGWLMKQRAKRAIKQNEAAFALLKRARQVFAR